MVFNAGRYDGYARWLCASILSRRSPNGARADEFGRLLPTASAVGVVSDDLLGTATASHEPNPLIGFSNPQVLILPNSASQPTG
jgi:hypothetical protein